MIFYEPKMFKRNVKLLKLKQYAKKDLSRRVLFLILVVSLFIWYQTNYNSFLLAIVIHLTYSFLVCWTSELSKFVRGAAIGLGGVSLSSWVKIYTKDEFLFSGFSEQTIQILGESVSQWILLFSSVLVGYLMTKELERKGIN
ncbi:membrane hypothetical protein [Vibrio aestuarianus]|nr:membrane hypothetical protein [Vibrio aestuarianus]